MLFKLQLFFKVFHNLCYTVSILKYKSRQEHIKKLILPVVGLSLFMAKFTYCAYV